MQSPEPISAAVSSPDWSRLGEELHCPLCEYNLRGLSEPRCPECGYQFQWADLLDPSKRKHPYLFEHHPERNIRSFVRTAVGGLWPWRFWRTLQPQQPSNVSRLWRYWLVSALLAVLSGLLLFVPFYLDAVLATRASLAAVPALVARLNQQLPPQQKAQIIQQFGSIQNYAVMALTRRASSVDLSFGRTFYGWLADLGPGMVTTLLLWIGWPWLIFAALMIFRQSMSIARVRTVHVLRCICYSYDGGVWGPLGALAATGTVTFTALTSTTPTPSFRPDWILGIMIYGMFGLMLYSGIRLIVAYRRYLKFRHCIATIASVHLIAFLTAIAVMFFVGEWLHGRM